MNAPDSKDPTPARHPSPSLPRQVGVSGVALSSFNTIVGSGIFGLPALVAALLGPAAILSYLVCTLLVALMGLCLAEAGSRVTSPGGLYAYARVPFGPIVGGIAGTLLWAANSVVTNAAIANFLATTLTAAWPALGLDTGAPRAAFLVALYLALASINIRGTRAGTRLSVTVAFLKLAPLVLLVVAGLFALKVPNLRWPEVPTAQAVGQGAVLLFFAFMGIEGGLNMSGEVRDPSRTIPRAIVLALVLTASLYIGLQFAAQGVLGPGLATAKAPLVETATAVFGPWGTRLLLATTMLSAVGFLCADSLCSPRSMYALAEAGQLPRILSAVHASLGTPAVAIGTYAFLALLVALTGTFRSLVIFASAGTLLLYLICCLGLLKLRAQNIAMAGPPFIAPGGALLPLGTVAIIVWMLSTLEWQELAATAGLVLVAGVLYAVRERTRAGRSTGDL